MNTVLFSIVILMFPFSLLAQARSIPREEYEKAFQYAVSETNEKFPFVHTFVSERFREGKLISKSVDVAERQAPGIERQTFSTTENGKTSMSYQLRTGFGENVYCSSDGQNWEGPQKYECSRSITVFGPREASSVEFTVEDKTHGGSKVKAYRRYEIFEDQTFIEEVATIRLDGLFVTTVETRGTIKDKSKVLKLTNTWDLKGGFSPIVKPSNVKTASRDQKLTIRRN